MNSRPAPPPFINLVKLDTSRPASFSFKDSEYAFRFGFLKRGWDVHLSYFHTWDDRPTMFTRKITYSFPGPFGPMGPPMINIYMEPKHTRIHQFGLNFEKAVYFPRWDRIIVFRGEGLYTLNRYYEHEDGFFTKRDSILSGLVIETTFFVDWMTALRLDNNFILNHNHHLLTLPIGKRLDDYQTGLTLSTRKDFDSDRASFEAWVAYTLDDGDSWWHLTLTYALTDNIKLISGLNLYYGNPDDLYGQFERNDNIEFGIKYSF